MRRLVLLLLFVSGVGCLGRAPPAFTLEPSDAPTTSPAADTYWMVWVHGRETRDLTFGVERYAVLCSLAFDHELDPQARTLRYDGTRYAIDPDAVEVVIAFDVWEAWSGCPAPMGLSIAPNASRDIGRLGWLDVQVRDDGALVVEGHEVRLGERARFAYSVTDWEGFARWRYEGDVAVETLGAWRRDGLLPVPG